MLIFHCSFIELTVAAEAVAREPVACKAGAAEGAMHVGAILLTGVSAFGAFVNLCRERTVHELHEHGFFYFSFGGWTFVCFIL